MGAITIREQRGKTYENSTNNLRVAGFRYLSIDEFGQIRGAVRPTLSKHDSAAAPGLARRAGPPPGATDVRKRLRIHGRLWRADSEGGGLLCASHRQQRRRQIGPRRGALYL